MAGTEILTDEDLPEDMDVLRRLPRSDTEEWLIGVSDFKGQSYATARVYYRDKENNLKPSRHGINVHEEMLPELLQGLTAADELLTERAGG